MKRQNFNFWEEKMEKKVKKREKKKKPKMKVSGAGVKKLQNIIINKNS
jgi:hypothetical protein